MSPAHHDHSADAAIDAMAKLPPATGTDGPGTDPRTPPTSARGPDMTSYLHRATLPITVELARQWHRKRTQFALGFMALLPFILAGAFTLGSDSGGQSGSTFIDLAQSSASNFVMVTLFFSSTFLLVVLVSLFFGDTVASEASWSSLKYLLAIPIDRTRLLRQKLVVAVILAVVALVVLVTVTAGLGALIYGTHAMTTPAGAGFTGWAAWGRVAIAVAYILLSLAWVAGLAFLMTVSTDVPLGAVGTAVMLSIVSQILDQITKLGSIRHFLPTHYAFAWTDALSSPIDWTDMTRGAVTSVAYATVLVVAAFLVFRRKDITS